MLVKFASYSQSIALSVRSLIPVGYTLKIGHFEILQSKDLGGQLLTLSLISLNLCVLLKCWNVCVDTWKNGSWLVNNVLHLLENCNVLSIHQSTMF